MTRTEEQQAYVKAITEAGKHIETMFALLGEEGEKALEGWDLSVWLDSDGYSVLCQKDELYKKLAKSLGGHRHKEPSQYGQAGVRRYFYGESGASRIVSILVRNTSTTCERVQVGTKLVPAVEAQPEREEPVYEWRCEPIND